MHQDKDEIEEMVLIIFMLLGVGQFSVNWTTGQWSFETAAVELLSASISRVSFGPWVVPIAFPLGAVAFLVLKGRHNEPAATDRPLASLSLSRNVQVCRN